MGERILVEDNAAIAIYKNTVCMDINDLIRYGKCA